MDAIYVFSDIHWWLQLLIFCFALLFSFFLPGLVLLSFTNVKKYRLLLAPIIGLVMWGLQGYIFGWLELRWLTYIYLIIFPALAVFRKSKLAPLSFNLKFPFWVWLLILIGSSLQLLAVWGSGWQTSSGYVFYWINSFDGLFHLSLTKMLVDHLPPLQPGATGLFVTNYHYLSNLVVADISRIWHLSINHLYFQFFPLWLSIWFGILITVLLHEWTNGFKASVWGLILYYFCGELSWLVIQVLKTTNSNPFEVYVDHGALQFLNPPQALAKITFLASLLLLRFYWKQKQACLAILIGISLGSLIGLKIYFGVAALIGLLSVYFLSLVLWIKKYLKPKHPTNLISSFFLTFKYDLLLLLSFALVAVILFIPSNSESGGLFFDFLNWPKLLLAEGKINWNEWWLRLQVYEEAHNLKALTVWYGLAISIFFVTLYNIRLFGFLAFLPRLSKGLTFEERVFIFIPPIVLTFIGMNFLQASGLHNVFNFFVVALFLLNLSTALVFASWSNKLWILTLLILLTILTCVQTIFLTSNYFQSYVHQTNRRVISPHHQEALNFIKQHTPANTILQTHPSHYLDHNTPYLYFFTDKQSYFGGRTILESHNQPIKDRSLLIEKLFSPNLSSSESATLAKSVGINMLVLENQNPAEQLFIDNAKQSGSNWQVIFENQEYTLISPTN